MMDEFYKKIQKQLNRMTEAEKDSWILSQAKILPTWEQEDFYKSICGTKKVINMPERDEISAFCEKVRNGDISVEYETHYVEFDDYGHFHDDWEHDFYDPKNAMSFVSSVIRGCHDLIVLEEYEDAFRILDDTIGLRFAIIDHPDTDDTCEDEYMDLDMAVHEGILSIDRNDLLRDYIESCRCSVKDSSIAAEKIYKYADMFGLSEKTGVEIAESDPSVSDKYPVPSMIGQGTHAYTTVGLSRYVTAVANKGTVYNLTLVDKIYDPNNDIYTDNSAASRRLFFFQPYSCSECICQSVIRKRHGSRSKRGYSVFRQKRRYPDEPVIIPVGKVFPGVAVIVNINQAGNDGCPFQVDSGRIRHSREDFTESPVFHRERAEKKFLFFRKDFCIFIKHSLLLHAVIFLIVPCPARFFKKRKYGL